MFLMIALFSTLLSIAPAGHVLVSYDAFGGSATPYLPNGQIGSRTVSPNDTTGGGPMLVPPPR
jgi:hypothetical protein